MTEPLTQRKIEVSVLAANYGSDPAYLIYFYDCPTLSKTEPVMDDSRHKRAAFTAIFSGESNGQLSR
ncbi:MAG: hypothetical protein R2912_06285 [Eubacteriales bacterium]